MVVKISHLNLEIILKLKFFITMILECYTYLIDVQQVMLCLMTMIIEYYTYLIDVQQVVLRLMTMIIEYYTYLIDVLCFHCLYLNMILLVRDTTVCLS